MIQNHERIGYFFRFSHDSNRQVSISATATKPMIVASDKECRSFVRAASHQQTKRLVASYYSIMTARLNQSVSSILTFRIGSDSAYCLEIICVSVSNESHSQIIKD